MYQYYHRSQHKAGSYVFTNCELRKLNVKPLASSPMFLSPQLDVSLLMVENPSRFPKIFRMECSRDYTVATKIHNSDLRLLPPPLLPFCIHHCTNQHPHSHRQLPTKTENSQGTEIGSFYKVQALFPGHPFTSEERRTLSTAPASFSKIGFTTVLDACGTHLLPLQIWGSESNSL